MEKPDAPFEIQEKTMQSHTLKAIVLPACIMLAIYVGAAGCLLAGALVHTPAHVEKDGPTVFSKLRAGTYRDHSSVRASESPL